MEGRYETPKFEEKRTYLSLYQGEKYQNGEALEINFGVPIEGY